MVHELVEKHLAVGDFAPHAKSMSLAKLAPRIAQLAGFGVTILTTPELGFCAAQVHADSVGVYKGVAWRIR
jgi:hypothetical protein